MGMIPQCEHGMSVGLCRICFPLPKTHLNYDLKDYFYESGQMYKRFISGAFNKGENHMEIEVGKFYKLRDGRKARVYATDGYNCKQIHGAIYYPDEGWSFAIWDEQGKFHRTCDSQLDIVAEWEDMTWDREALVKFSQFDTLRIVPFTFKCEINSGSADDVITALNMLVDSIQTHGNGFDVVVRMPFEIRHDLVGGVHIYGRYGFSELTALGRGAKTFKSNKAYEEFIEKNNEVRKEME